MAIIRSLTLVLTNQDDLAKVWNIGGSATGVEVVKRTKVYVGESAEGLVGSENNYIGNAYYSNEPAEAFIGTAAEEALDAPSDQQAKEDISKFNGELYAHPFLLNRIKLYTSNAKQLVEKFYYYKQVSGGIYEKQNLDVLPHYNFENPRAVLDMDSEDIGGEIILDVNRRFEVKVLPHTILILDLIYETAEKENSGETSASEERGDEILDDLVAGLLEKDLKELKEADFEDIRLFVKTYFKYGHSYEQQTGVPVLFSLAEAAMISGLSIQKAGENLYLKEADSKWKGETIASHVEICGSEEIIEDRIIEEIKEPENDCGDSKSYLVERYLRAYPSPIHAMADHYSRLQKEKFRQVFALKRMSYSFAGTLSESKYSKSEQFGENIVRMMRLIEPYILEEKRFLFHENRALRQKQAIVLVTTGVLFFVLFCLVLK